jgi:hypothetical protein
MKQDPSGNLDLPALARKRVDLGPAPAWILPCSYDVGWKSRTPGPVTELLIEQQANAEQGQIYFRRVLRLETPQAVQHYSQWRLEFEPQTQCIRLHSILVCRGSLATNRLDMNRFQFLQREAGLEGFVIDGWITLLLLLEDVSPGDVLEFSYTVTSRTTLLPEGFSCLFSLPAGVEVGKHFFSVRHANQRPLRARCSSPELAPEILAEGVETCHVLLKEQFLAPEPEEATPRQELGFPWIQVSDCPDWQTVARAVVEAWKEDVPGDGFARLVEELKGFAPDLPSRINRAIEVVQDDFRYLSVNLELGGSIPTGAETVIRRRYGDCKDLSFLLVRLLRALGVSARPVLVSTTPGRRLAELLPSASVFNHVIVEYELCGEKRWVDPTLPRQGGGAGQRCVPDYGLGLPIDASTCALAPVPQASMLWGSYEIQESLILDTTGKPSYLAIVTTAKGVQADQVRCEFLNEGIEVVSKKRLQACANRYSLASRMGPLQYHDDRQQNVFVVAETFEISGFLKVDEVPNSCIFSIQSPSTAGMLFCPPLGARRGSFALPFPCQQTHSVEIQSTAWNAKALPLYLNSNSFFNFSRRTKSLPRYVRITFALETLARSIPAERVPEHRRRVEAVWAAASVQIRLPTGHARMRKPVDFGALPASKPATGQSAAPTNGAATSGGANSGSKGPASHNQGSEPGSGSNPATLKLVGKRPPIDLSRLASAPGEGTPAGRQSRPARGHATNRNSWIAFCLLLLAIIMFALTGLVTRAPGPHEGAGLLFLLVLVLAGGAVSMAIVSLRQGSRHPERYPRGKQLALVTLTFGSAFALLMLLILLFALVRAPSRTAARAQDGSPLPANRTSPLNFRAFNFVYNPPAFPWVQTDARELGRGPVLAFVRPSSLRFVVCAGPLEPGLIDARGRVVERCKEDTRRNTTSYELLTEGEILHHGLPGWQTETLISVQGHQFFFISWMLATNGFGYQLIISGPPDLKTQIQNEADSVFSGFVPTTP